MVELMLLVDIFKRWRYSIAEIFLGLILRRGGYRLACRRPGFDSRSIQTQVVKTGSDSSTAKRSATDVSVRVLEDDLYKRMSRVTVGVPC